MERFDDHGGPSSLPSRPVSLKVLYVYVYVHA